jgi:hypothetical protein
MVIEQVSTFLAPGCLPVFSSDGLNQYFYAITAHFGYWDKPPRARKYHWFVDERLQYAQLRKLRQGRKVTFLSSIIRLGSRNIIRDIVIGLELSGLVQTSFVERANLTLRKLIAPLSRRTWSMAYDQQHLWLHIQWALAYCHLARAHHSLLVRVRGSSSTSLSHASDGCRADQTSVVGGVYPALASAGKDLVGSLSSSLSLHTNRNPPGRWIV